MSDIDDSEMNLSGKLLIAMPGMGDPRFEKSVVFMCAHSPEGAMGLIVNKPSEDLSLGDVLSQLEIDASSITKAGKIFFGGPVEGGRGFVLHSGEYDNDDSTLKVDDAFSMTATRDILEAIAHGEGPEEALAALGYAGWSPGQIEDEIQQNAWLTCDAEKAIVFAADDKSKWTAALAKLGIDPLLLSAEGGSA
ncbi:YqgE/AlgH family protein [Aliiroseovarius sp. F20344]|uniref:YqgE/AlgH family protein n=1 Tax=Aliiroseovarius sp. F20344 TaxID=2926414 RepID=UPI001FF2D685|nr:YqgE/AlgH family protein [Aliiroseovarius sp. F20344]MCK0140963.1 YqgE/AlgH family protein [Aliiroseovarius sp. F20344]